MFRLAAIMSGAVAGTYLAVSYLVSPLLEYTNEVLVKMDTEQQIKEQQLAILNGADPTILITPTAVGPEVVDNSVSNCNTGFVKTKKFSEIKGETVMRFTYHDEEHAFVLLDNETLYFTRKGDSCFNQKSYDREIHQVGMKELHSCSDKDTEISCLQ